MEFNFGTYLDEKSKLHDKKRILFEIDYNQEYLLNFIKFAKNEFDIYFIHYASPKELKTSAFLQYGEIIYWKNFRNAVHLLQTVRPYKVIFFELETLNQLALNTACKELGIKTGFCEHGLKLFSTSQDFDQRIKGSKNGKTLSRLFQFPIDRYKNRMFFERTKSVLSEKAKEFLIKYREVRFKNSIHATGLKIQDKYMHPDEYYSISAKNFEYRKAINKGLDLPVSYFGLIDFDEIREENEFKEKSYIVYIDQPYAKIGLFGWDESVKVRWLESIDRKCRTNNFKLLVIKHPRELKSTWSQLINITCEDSSELVDFLPKTAAVIGYNSTLLASLAVKHHVAVFCFATHPDGSKNDADIFVNEGIANWLNREEIPDKKMISEALETQQKFKVKFKQQWIGVTNERASDRLKFLYHK